MASNKQVPSFAKDYEVSKNALNYLMNEIPFEKKGFKPLAKVYCKNEGCFEVSLVLTLGQTVQS